jgi:predicted permease
MTGRWREALGRLLRLGRSHRAHADLEAEFASHRQMAIDEYLRQGHTADEASRLAALRFGSPLAARERVDDQRSVPGLEHLAVDLRYALRGLRRTPAFTAAAVIVLGAGIAVNLAVFTVTSATLFKGFRGIPDQDRLVYVTAGRGCCLSHLDLTDWRARTTGFAGVEAVADLRVSIDTGRTVETATATEVTAGLFGLLRVAPMVGRDFSAADDRPGAARVAILSHDFWRTRFDAGSSAIGTAVLINGEPVTIIGVMPEGFVFPQRQDLWMAMGPRVAAQPRNGRGLWLAVARLGDNVTIEQARAEMQSVGAHLAAAYPATNTGVTPFVQTFSEFFVGPNATAIYGSLWVGVGVLLLIACANLVNLLLARATGRARETGVRLALGAGRLRIARLYLFESLLLSVAGGLLAWWLTPLLLSGYASVAVPPTQPWAGQLLDYTIDRRAGGYLAAIVFGVGMVTGLIPALRASAVVVNGVLRDGGRGTMGGVRQRRITNAIVIVQVGLAVVLLSAAGVLLRSVLNVHQRSLGYDPSRVLVALSSLPAASYPDVEAQFQFFDRAAAGVGSIPGVDAVAFVDGVAGQRSGTIGIEIEGQPFTSDAQTRAARQSSISGGYFTAMGTALVAGRDFSGRDTASAPAVVIVNRRFAYLHWQTDDVLGRRMRVHTGTSAGAWLTVVGLAPDLHQGERTRADVEPTFYRPMRQRPGRGAWLVAHTSAAAPQSLIAPMRHHIQQADPTVPIWLGPYTLDIWNTGQYWQRAVNGGLFTVFAVMALFLACLGLLAVMQASVAGRRQEISVRMALGASAADVLRLIARQGLQPALVGLAAGVVVSLATNQLLASQLVDVSPWDPTALAAVAVTMLVAALVGCFAPAVQAMRVDPLQAMRGD